MKPFNYDRLVRKNILTMKPYSSARDEFSGADAIFLDANENPFDSGLNRYPDPYQRELKKSIGQVKGVAPENIFLGNGSDEPIDLLFRVFCEPRVDNVLAIQPTYGMYQVCAGIQDVEYRHSLLTRDFQMNLPDLFSKIDARTKLVFICSPNNPSSNSLNSTDIIKVIEEFKGLVVLDEAYIDFSSEKGLLERLLDFPNLVILQTFSKAWGMAGIRLGMAFAAQPVIALFNKIKYPYNINVRTQSIVMEKLSNREKVKEEARQLIEQRNTLCHLLQQMPFVKEILPSDANFLMVRVDHPRERLIHLQNQNIIVRDRSSVPLCEGCLRITIGTKDENEKLMEVLQQFKPEQA